MDKTFDAKTAEPRINALWDKAGAFKAGAGAAPGAETFCVMIPPPNVTGSLHMGHAFNNTLQDVLVRWHRMRGHDTLWQPGTDHAGIATQMVVERELAQTNRRRTDFTREEFTALVWEQKRKSRGNIRGQLERLGASCDWSREAFTMSGAPGAPAGEEGNFHDAVIKVFVDLYNKGLIYRGKRLVNWDPHFETAISDLEVEQTEVAGHMWHFKYPLAGGATYTYREKDADGNVTFEEERDYISIATTRPETMLGDGAVAVHPSDERYAPIIGKLCEIPVGPKENRRLIPIITDEYPDPLFGSGAVKITGAHDFNDYAVAKRAGIPCYRLMDTKAAMRADGAPYADAAATAQRISRSWLVRKGYVPPGFAEQPYEPGEAEVDALNLVPDELRGLDRYEARKRVVEAITAEGLAVMVRADDPRLGKAATRPGLDPGPRAEPGAAADGEVPGQARDGAFLVPMVESKTIMQPFGDRSKVVIEPMLTDQWFVDTAKIVEPALEAVRSGRTKILPEAGEKTYFHWLENIEPWCISRQLWWGHQIPVWYLLGRNQDGSPGPDNGSRPAKIYCGATFEEVAGQIRREFKVAKVLEVSSTDPNDPSAANDFDVFATNWSTEHDQKAEREWINAQPNADELNRKADIDGLGQMIVYRDPDVLDTWFSSGLWPIGTLGWPEDTPEMRRYFPTSVLITGFDIIFFWVARMMMMQLAVVNDVPFHTVYLHGLVRDAKGKKMSKSLGNVVDPLEAIDEFGADALRFANAAMATLGGVLKFDIQRIQGYRNFGTKLWNACRFAELNGVWEGHTTQAQPPQATATGNRWILGETGRARVAVDAALAAYRFDQAATALYDFVWGKVCDWYVEFAKPLLDGPQAAETRATMGWVLDQCMVLLHPIMPFVTEELWQTTRANPGTLALARWPSIGNDLVDPAADRELNWAIRLIEDIRSARSQMGVPVGLKLDLVQVDLDEAGKAAWARNADLIRRLARIDTLTEGPAPKGSVALPCDGGLFALPLAGVIDIAGEKARLQKALDALEKELAALQARLSNPAFLAKAKEEVVDEAKARLETGTEEAAKLRAALARLAELG